MINRIKSLLAGKDARPAASSSPVGGDEVQLAAAALLVEAAWQDRDFDAAERHRVMELVMDRFALTPEEAATLVAAAEKEVEGATQILPFTRTIKDRFSHEERIEMVEMLWQVVYADGVLHDHEAALMRQIGGLVYVSDQERGAARKRALAKRGVPAAQVLKGKTTS
jgi:uncharacterized tellurite resistance protein B-like protein